MDKISDYPTTTFKDMSKECLNLLIVEDDPDDLMIVQEALKSTQFRFCISLARTGKELVDMMEGKGAFENLEKPQPDFVILDINLPIMDGLEALASLRQSGVIPQVPVFILTTSANPRHIMVAKELGAKKYYSKPDTLLGFEQIFSEIIDSF